MIQSAREDSSAIKELSKITGDEIFLAEHIEADETTAWELAAMSVHVLNAIGLYRSPGEKSHLFLAIMRENVYQSK